jgi:hypothetical protein
VKFEDRPIEHQEMIAESRGMTLAEYKDRLATPPPMDMSKWSEEQKANAIAKFTTPSTSIVTHADGSRTAYQAPSSDDPNGEWAIYSLDNEPDATRFEEMFP